MTSLVVRAAIGLLATVAIALAARRARSLSRSGALAAVVVGTAAVAAGWGWGTLLFIYFVLSTLLSRAGAAEKAARTAGILEKGGARDATQAIANGGVFALCALGTLAAAPATAPGLAAAAAGALASATPGTTATH